MARIRGTGGGDRLVGTNQDDTIIGLQGDDDLSGRGGDDALLGGPGDDIIDPGTGTDQVLGGPGIDRVVYLDAAHGVTVDLSSGIAVDGAGARDQLSSIEEAQGSAFADVLLGSDGPSFEQFIATSGNDEIDGRGGRDQVDYGNAPSGIQANLETGRIIDGFGSVDMVHNIEEIDGSFFNDTLIGRAANATFEEFEGRRGNDVIDGGGARHGTIGLDEADYRGSPAAVVVDLTSGWADDGFGTVDRLAHIEAVDGSDFDDRLLGSNNEPGEVEFFTGHRGDDLIDGRQGLDRVFYDREDGDRGVTVDLAAGTARDSFGGLDTLVGIEQVNGTPFADILLGDAGDNRFEGREGGDRINGRAGNDELIGGAGVDILVGGSGNDVIEGDGGADRISGGGGADLLSGGSGNDELRGQGGADRMLGGGGADLLSGAGGNDELLGGAGADRILGGAGADTLSGAGGNDELLGGAGADRILGGAGADTLTGGAGNDELLGGAGADRILGGAGADTLTGGAGADRMLGGAGADTLTGGAGADILEGGAGSDVFRFLSLAGQPDVIRDFSLSDRIELVDVLQPNADIASSVVLQSDGANAVLQVDAGSGNFVTVATLEGQAGLSVDDLLASDALVAS